MAGHSKWANIKHKKAAQDSKRSKNFQKISKEISVAIQEKGNDINTNSKLKLIIEKAKSYNIPNENIKRLLEKKPKNEENYQEIIYEGYGPEGTAIIIETLTDNVNRTAAFVKSILSKYGGNLGTTNSVAYLFETEGLIIFERNYLKTPFTIENLLDLEIKDLIEEEEIIVLKTNLKDIFLIREELQKLDIKDFLEFEITKTPNAYISVSENATNNLEIIIEKLEDHDDIQKVYTNLK